MSAMSGLLEVIALSVADAERAADGGADRVEVVGTMDEDGLSPEPRLVESIREAVSIQVRPMVRLRGGFGTDGGEATRLRGLVSSYLDSGADGVVLGFLNGLNEVDLDVCAALLDGTDCPWTFHRAVDAVLDVDRAWSALVTAPRLDAVLTAGSARGVEQGLDALIGIAADPVRGRLVMAGGGLRPEHVPWLARAGVRAFHVGRAVRPQGSLRAHVDEDLVRGWRGLVDAEVKAARPRTRLP